MKELFFFFGSFKNLVNVRCFSVILTCVCYKYLYSPLVPSAAGTDYEVTAANPTAAGSGGRQLRLEWGSLLWAQQGRKADSAGNAPGNGEAPEAAAATESPAAERPGECQL